jgi:hypothetical protein
LSNRLGGARDHFGASTVDLPPSQRRVRESDNDLRPPTSPSPVSSPPAHRSNRITVQLNANWIDDPLQWVLQRRKGNPRKKNSGWQDRSFCTTREGLLRCVRELCGLVDHEVLAQLRALPEFHSKWSRPDEECKTSTFTRRPETQPE